MFKFFAPKSECFTKYDAFCSYIFDYVCLECKAYCYVSKKFEIMEKLHSSKTYLKTAGGEDASPTSLLDPPLPARTMFLTTTPTSRFGFSMMCGKFCQSCVKITARSALAQFGHFTLKTKVRFEKGGFRPPKPPPSS